MARQPATPAPHPVPKEVAELQRLLEEYKKSMREESLALRNSPEEGRDYNHFILVGSRELAILDSLRFLRGLTMPVGATAKQVFDGFQERVDAEVAEAEIRKTLLNDYEKMLGQGAEEGYAIVQKLVDSVRPEKLAITV